MFCKGTILFLQFPHESRTRLLHQGTVLDVSPGAFQAMFEEEKLPIAAGQELMIYFDRQGKFLKQPARVIVVHDPASTETTPADPAAEQGGDDSVPMAQAIGLVCALQPVGQPVSAESRQSYRVSTVISDRRAELNGEMCKLLDVSASGYAVISRKQYKFGQILEGAVTLHHETFRGQVCVQSIRELGEGRYRYGLYCAEDRAQRGGLKEGLPKLTMALQIEQLRRRSGVA